MERASLAGRLARAVLLTLVVLFFLFPIVWVLLMSFQTNEQILRIPPSIFFEPTLANYEALISGKLETAAGTLEIPFMNNLKNSVILSTASVILALILGVPAAYAFARDFMGVKSFAEAVELQAAFARKQFETISEQTRELQTLAQKVSTDATRPVRQSFEKAFKGFQPN